ncbi:hypothetical protein HMI55_005629 [Coelomomyces lativittatus]|nr:hypothetical protein HMI55_005629 [Coelomomyces lativittatus]
MFPYCLNVTTPSIPLSPLQTTFVLYPSHQPYLKYLAFASLIPYFLFIAQCTLILARWNEPIWLKFVFGQCWNQIINSLLKKLIQQPRPTLYLGEGYGMPSSHSQYMTFFCLSVYFISRNNSLKM